MASLAHQLIIEAIDTAPLNRGLKGVDWLARKENVAVAFDNGDVALFDWEGDGAYEGHYLFVSHGREALRHARAAIQTMFAEHDAALIFGMVPVFRRDVKLMTRWLGFRSAGVRQTSEGPCELFVLSKFQWKVANS